MPHNHRSPARFSSRFRLLLPLLNNISTLTDCRISNSLYPDDTSHSVDIIKNLLQIHLDHLNEYFIESDLRVNVNILLIPKREITLPKFNRELGWAQEILYLGVTLDKTLTFRKDIKNINSKVVGKIKSIQHLIHPNITIKSKKILYSSLVRPVMTYAFPTWCFLA